MDARRVNKWGGDPSVVAAELPGVTVALAAAGVDAGPASVHLVVDASVPAGAVVDVVPPAPVRPPVPASSAGVPRAPDAAAVPSRSPGAPPSAGGLPTRWSRLPNVVDRRTLQGVMVLPAEGPAVVLDGLAARVWEAVAGPVPGDELARGLVRTGAAGAVADVEAALRDLQAIGAVRELR